MKAVSLGLWIVYLLFPLSFTKHAGAEAAQALLLFGESDHKTFLGCLNCPDTSNISVCNDLGKYGSGLGRFGSDLSPVSPWNSLSSNAPIIADKVGSSYGYFSTNTLHHDRTRIEWLLAVLDYYEKTNDLEKTQKKMCG